MSAPSPSPSGTAPRLPLALRQQQLLARSSELRQQWVQQTQTWQRPLAWLDRGMQAWQWLRARPAVPLAAAVALVLLRPRRAWRWSMTLWWGWRQWRRLQRALDPRPHLRTHSPPHSRPR